MSETSYRNKLENLSLHFNSNVYDGLEVNMDIAVEKGCFISLLFIIIFGVLGNILSFVVFHKGKVCSALGCSAYFKCLAISDIIVLLSSGLPALLMFEPFNIFYSTINEVFCKVAMLNLYFSVEVSTWIIVIVTVDRTLSIYFPLKFGKMLYATKSIYMKVVCIIIACFLLNAYFLVYARLYYNNGVVRCSIDDEAPFHAIYITLSSVLLIFFLPTIVNTTCNILIIKKLYNRNLGSGGSGLTEGQTAPRNTGARNVTYRVIAVSIVHFLATSPFVLIQAAYVLELPEIKTIYVVSAVAQVLFFLNSGVNFILFCVTGRDFRRDVRLMSSNFTGSRVTSAIST